MIYTVPKLRASTYRNLLPYLIHFPSILTSIATTVKLLWLPYLIASSLIIYGFTWSLPDYHFLDRSFQADENAAVWAVSQIHFPLYYPRWLPWGTGLFYQAYLVRSVLTVGGLLHAADANWTLIAGRIVVYLSALGVVTFTFLLGRKLFDTRTGWLAALLLSPMPGFVVNSHYFKTDVPALCWTLAAMFAAFTLRSAPSPSRVVLLGLLIGYAASVKYDAGLMFPVGIMVVAVAQRQRNAHWLLRPYLPSVIIGFAIGEPYGILNFAGLVSAIHWVEGLNRAGVPYVAIRPPALIDYYVDVLPFSMTTPLLISSGLALIYVLAHERWRLAPIWLYLGLYSLLLSVDNMRIVRYTLPLLPFAALFVAYTVRSLTTHRRFGPVVIAACSAIVAYTYIFSLSYVHVMTLTDPRVQASHWIELNVAKSAPLPMIETGYLNVPQIWLFGYKQVQVSYDIGTLSGAKSPYFVLTDFGPLFYEEGLSSFPKQQAFFAYVHSHYHLVASFENSQTLLGVDSKHAGRIPQDWLFPNPKITILERNSVPQRTQAHGVSRS